MVILACLVLQELPVYQAVLENVEWSDSQVLQVAEVSQAQRGKEVSRVRLVTVELLGQLETLEWLDH